MEIQTEPTYQHVTWVIGDFFDLPQESEFFLDSPPFLFHDDRYGIRLYPKLNGDETSFHLRRLSVNFPENKVSCKMGLRRRKPNGDEFYYYVLLSLEKDSPCPRSVIEEKRDVYVPDGSLTVVCCMWLSEVSRTGSSTEAEEEEEEFPGHNVPFSSRRSPAKMELTTESPCTHVELTVPNVFELLRETYDSLTSPEFHFAGNNYCFRFGTNGITADRELQLVRLTSTFTENAVYYRVGYGFNSRPIYSSNSRLLVDNVGLCCNLEEESDNFVQNGEWYLVLFLRLGEQRSAGALQNGLTDIEKLQSNYRQLFQNGTESDACVVVRGKEFPVHRVVLRARSTVFEAMFGHDTAEKQSGRVVVDDLDPDTFGDFLEYLYTGDVASGLWDDNTFGLYVAADKYDVATLKSKCVERMRRTLSVDTFCDVVSLALRHSEEDLLQQTIRFLRDNFQRIMITAKWQQFNIDNGATANELFNKAFLPGTRSSPLS